MGSVVLTTEAASPLTGELARSACAAVASLADFTLAHMAHTQQRVADCLALYRSRAGLMSTDQLVHLTFTPARHVLAVSLRGPVLDEAAVAALADSCAQDQGPAAISMTYRHETDASVIQLTMEGGR